MGKSINLRTSRIKCLVSNTCHTYENKAATLYSRFLEVTKVFRVSPCCETPSYKYYLIMIKHSFSPKMWRKNFENRFTNKNLMSKKFFEEGFCIGKGDNPKIFNVRFWQICQLYSNIR